jgi:beta-glucanase (GH16 family)
VASAEIINPIQSARMVTSDSFSFTNGTIEIRAKMPKGDWIWPGKNTTIIF